MRVSTLKRRVHTSRKRRSSHLSVPEALETRTLLSRVKIALVGRDIVVKGNGQDNAVVVDLAAENPEDIFQGENGTRIRFDGQLRRAARRGELPRFDDIRVRMRGGNDTFVVAADGFVSPDNILVDMGFGEDTFVMIAAPEDPAFVNGSLRVRSRGKESAIGLFNIDVRDNLRIKTGRSDDVVGMSAVNVGGRTNVVTRGGEDGVVAIDSLLDGNTRINLGASDDFVAAINSDVDGTLRATGSAGSDVALVHGNSTADRFVSRSIEDVVTSLNDLPNGVVNEIEGRLNNLAQEANSALPGNVANVVTDEIDRLLGILEHEDVQQTTTPTIVSGTATDNVNADASGNGVFFDAMVGTPLVGFVGQSGGVQDDQDIIRIAVDPIQGGASIRVEGTRTLETSLTLFDENGNRIGVTEQFGRFGQSIWVNVDADALDGLTNIFAVVESDAAVALNADGTSYRVIVEPTNPL